jgi:hypothetical protein
MVRQVSCLSRVLNAEGSGLPRSLFIHNNADRFGHCLGQMFLRVKRLGRTQNPLEQPVEVTDELIQWGLDWWFYDRIQNPDDRAEQVTKQLARATLGVDVQDDWFRDLNDQTKNVQEDWSKLEEQDRAAVLAILLQDAQIVFPTCGYRYRDGLFVLDYVTLIWSERTCQVTDREELIILDVKARDVEDAVEYASALLAVSDLNVLKIDRKAIPQFLLPRGTTSMVRFMMRASRWGRDSHY